MIRLVPMTEADFEAFLKNVNARYAAEKVEAGHWKPDEALERARQAHQNLLPHSLATPNNYLYMITQNGSEQVGFLWFAVDQQYAQTSAYVYQFEIYEPYRRQHFGTQAFRALEVEVKKLGVHRIALNVFGPNTAARALYEKLGYSITNLNMAKMLD